MLELVLLGEKVAEIRAGKHGGMFGNGLEQERRAAWLREDAERELRGLPS